MWKQVTILSIIFFVTFCNSAVVKQKLKDKIKEEELKEQQKLSVQINENDEELTTVRIIDPPIQHQFVNVLQNGVGQGQKNNEEEDTSAEVKDKPEPVTPVVIPTIEKEGEDENEHEVEVEVGTATATTVKSKPVALVEETTNKVETEEDKESEEEEKNIEVTESDPDTEDEDEDVVRKAKAKQVQEKNNLFRKGVDCGYYSLRPGSVLSVTTPNFGNGTLGYKNNWSCTWKFFGHHCVIRTTCPCFDIPLSPNCRKDFLKLTDMYSFAERFCGESKPSGSYKSTTNNLVIRFNSEWKSSEATANATGFICHTTCTGPGKEEPKVINKRSCPNSLKSES